MTFWKRSHKAAFLPALLATTVMATTVLVTNQPAAADADRFAGMRSVERLRGEPSDRGQVSRDPRGARSPRGERRGGGFFGWGGWNSDADYDRYDPEPVKAYVSAPKYHTYKPDTLKTVTLDDLSRVVAEAAAQRRAEAEAARLEAERRAAANVSSEHDDGIRVTGSIATSGDKPVNDVEAETAPASQDLASEAPVSDVATGEASTPQPAQLPENADASEAVDSTGVVEAPAASEGEGTADALDSTGQAANDAVSREATTTEEAATEDTSAPETAVAPAENASDPETAVAPAVEVEQPAVAAGPSEFARQADLLNGMRVRALPEVIEALEAHYAATPDYLWVKDGKVTARARAVMETLADAGAVGLDARDYHVNLPHETVSMTGGDVEVASNNAGDDSIATDATAPLAGGTLGTSSEARDLMRFEIDLTKAVLTYALDAQRGRVDPDRISGYHDLPRHKVDLAAILNELSAKSDADIATAMLDLNPTNGEFKALMTKLAILQDQSEEKPVTIATGTLIKPGQSSAEMANVVKAIDLKASDELKAKHAATFDAYDGGDEYTPELVALVKDFQREAGLTSDGVVGRNTVRGMVGMSLGSKIEKIKLSMERLRWLPRDLGARHVFINQPAFTATYVQDGQEPLKMRAVVGRKSNQTNFFYDKIKTVEYNPYWGVPYSIIVNEMIPHLNKNPYYLDDRGYEVSTVNGRTVSSASVDWHAVASKQQSVNVRQLPGASNALGELKILFPNKHHIYMHDTPAKALFKRDARAFSHGCVRLQDPRGMAAAVLGKDKTYIAGRIAQGKNESDSVTSDVPVYVSYFTAWPDEKTGNVKFFADMYDRDMYLQRALRATEKARHG
ncbi:L,D-transpeptidase family protein [Breoghania sp.]|uniref:L,D-transpeptidase family protein n=1 Tax=Breoghania sp. TaxID=2065378 RepID=UPI002AAAA1B8|nr:L,D-transpeptidase family protein [Breoghania sp.]